MFLGSKENFFVKEVFWFDEKYPLLGPKNDFYEIWIIGYGFGYVLMIQKFTALELKPHLWNNDDLWKKIWHFKHWKSLHSYHVAPILAFKSSSQYGYLEGFKWPVLWNLSLIFIIMRIHEKILDTLSTGIVCTATILKISQWGCPTEISSI